MRADFSGTLRDLTLNQLLPQGQSVELIQRICYPRGLSCNGTNMSDLSFSALRLKPELKSNLDSIGYQRMTNIQSISLPHILQGKDVIGQAETGSGKTAAFGLGVLNQLNVKRFCIQTLILCPTRELADQVAGELRKLARGMHNVKILTLCGGSPMGPQIGSLEHGAHIIVGTPGRIEDHLNKGRLDFSNLASLVLDEADRMLDMGFQPSLDAILTALPNQRQTLLFSATFQADIEQMSTRVMNTPLKFKAGPSSNTHMIEQKFYRVQTEEHRFTALCLLLQDLRPVSTLVFCTTKKEVDQVCQQLNKKVFSALALHGDMEQRDRDQTLICFSNNSASILVATDVAARGLDIPALDLVVNYQLARDAETHTHRIGRTGRAGASGLACSLFSDKESFKLARLNLPASILDPLHNTDVLPALAVLEQKPPYPAMVTLQIDAGKKQKVRAGDILGALTAGTEVAAEQIGRIHVVDNAAFIAVHHNAAKVALKKLAEGKIKGRSCRARRLG